MISAVPNRRRRFLLLAALVLLQGCSQSSDATKGSSSGKAQADQGWSVEITNTTLIDAKIYQKDGVSYATNVHGVDYEVHGGLPGFVNIDGDTIHIVNGSNQLEAQDGLLVVNGNDAGNIQHGDKVVLDAEGKLWVNKERQ